ncbi:hypothetical protein ADUPG1_007974 [Aduncisulcus paluster]|uniref:ABC transporter domain-containing protein n=1 Tax=Aduncisulcus paluster TaxID=2918883 RepID=A0ABQ5KQ95_9EUKA|nr:hypothetical protein ADUPG1_007974 [Aduncisulcus paluster]
MEVLDRISEDQPDCYVIVVSDDKKVRGGLCVDSFLDKIGVEKDILLCLSSSYGYESNSYQPQSKPSLASCDLETEKECYEFIYFPISPLSSFIADYIIDKENISSSRVKAFSSAEDIKSFFADKKRIYKAGFTIDDNTQTISEYQDQDSDTINIGFHPFMYSANHISPQLFNTDDVIPFGCEGKTMNECQWLLSGQVLIGYASEALAQISGTKMELDITSSLYPAHIEWFNSYQVIHLSVVAEPVPFFASVLFPGVLFCVLISYIDIGDDRDTKKEKAILRLGEYRVFSKFYLVCSQFIGCFIVSFVAMCMEFLWSIIFVVEPCNYLTFGLCLFLSFSIALQIVSVAFFLHHFVQKRIIGIFIIVLLVAASIITVFQSYFILLGDDDFDTNSLDLKYILISIFLPTYAEAVFFNEVTNVHRADDIVSLQNVNSQCTKCLLYSSFLWFFLFIISSLVAEVFLYRKNHIKTPKKHKNNVQTSICEDKSPLLEAKKLSNNEEEEIDSVSWTNDEDHIVFVEELDFSYDRPRKVKGGKEKEEIDPDSFEITQDHISRHHKNRKEFSLKSLSFSIGPKQSTAILGKSGEGKTTLFSLLLGELKPSSGSISFSPAQEPSIGYMPQESNELMFPWLTVCQHVQLAIILKSGKWVRPDAIEVRQLIEKAQLDFDEHGKLHPGQMSGGMKRRLCLAMAMADAPSILLLDEPTVGLDPVTRSNVWDTLRHIAQTEGKNIVFSSHIIEEIEALASDVIVISNGRCTWESKVKDMIDCGVQISVLKSSKIPNSQDIHPSQVLKLTESPSVSSPIPPEAFFDSNLFPRDKFSNFSHTVDDLTQFFRQYPSEESLCISTQSKEKDRSISFFVYQTSIGKKQPLLCDMYKLVTNIISKWGIASGVDIDHSLNQWDLSQAVELVSNISHSSSNSSSCCESTYDSERSSPPMKSSILSNSGSEVFDISDSLQYSDDDQIFSPRKLKELPLPFDDESYPQSQFSDEPKSACDLMNSEEQLRSSKSSDSVHWSIVYCYIRLISLIRDVPMLVISLLGASLISIVMFFAIAGTSGATPVPWLAPALDLTSSMSSASELMYILVTAEEGNENILDKLGYSVSIPSGRCESEGVGSSMCGRMQSLSNNSIHSTDDLVSFLMNAGERVFDRERIVWPILTTLPYTTYYFTQFDEEELDISDHQVEFLEDNSILQSRLNKIFFDSISTEDGQIYSNTDYISKLIDYNLILLGIQLCLKTDSDEHARLNCISNVLQDANSNSKLKTQIFQGILDDNFNNPGDLSRQDLQISPIIVNSTSISFTQFLQNFPLLNSIIPYIGEYNMHQQSLLLDSLVSYTSNNKIVCDSSVGKVFDASPYPTCTDGAAFWSVCLWFPAVFIVFFLSKSHEGTGTERVGGPVHFKPIIDCLIFFGVTFLSLLLMIGILYLGGLQSIRNNGILPLIMVCFSDSLCLCCIAILFFLVFDCSLIFSLIGTIFSIVIGILIANIVPQFGNSLLTTPWLSFISLAIPLMMMLRLTINNAASTYLVPSPRLSTWDVLRPINDGVVNENALAFNKLFLASIIHFIVIFSIVAMRKLPGLLFSYCKSVRTASKSSVTKKSRVSSSSSNSYEMTSPVLHECRVPASECDDHRSLLKASSISKSFQNNHVLKNVSLEMKRGERWALLARSGGGKSTLINILCGDSSADSGIVSLMDDPLTLKASYRYISIVGQDDSLFSHLTVFEHVYYLLLFTKISKIEAKTKALQILSSLGFDSTDLVKYPHALSGGMRRRLSVSLSFVNQGYVAFFDEVAVGLDVISKKNLVSALIGSCEGKACLIATHDTEVVEWFATHVFVLVNGSIVERGTVKEVRDKAPWILSGNGVEGKEDVLSKLKSTPHPLKIMTIEENISSKMWKILVQGSYDYVRELTRDLMFGVHVQEPSLQTLFVLEMYFHGVNVVYKVDPFYPSTGEFDPQLSFNADDIAFLKTHGFNLVRLGVQFDGTFPTCSFSEPDEDYLDTMLGIVQDLAQAGIYTIIDMHQDLFSKWFCGEGFPPCLFPSDWWNADKPFPEPYEDDLDRDSDGFPTHDSCLEYEFGMYYPTVEQGKAWECLYNNCNPFQETAFGGTSDSTLGTTVQDLLLRHWSVVKDKFESEEYVFGWELVNEPWLGDIYAHPEWALEGWKSDEANLTPLYHNIISSSLAGTGHLVLYESTVSNYLKVGFPEGGFPDDLPYGSQQNILSVHDYCALVNSNMDPLYQWICDAWDEVLIVDQREIDVANLGLGGMILTEFGAIVDEDDSAIEDLQHILSDYERHMLSFCYWQFKTYNDVTTAAGSGSEGFWSEDGTLFEKKLKALARPYPMEVEGELISFSFDVDTNKLEVHVQPDVTRLTYSIIFTSEDLYYPNGYNVSFDPVNSGSYEVSRSSPAIHSSRGEPITTYILHINEIEYVIICLPFSCFLPEHKPASQQTTQGYVVLARNITMDQKFHICESSSLVKSLPSDFGRLLSAIPHFVSSQTSGMKKYRQDIILTTTGNCLTLFDSPSGFELRPVASSDFPLWLKSLKTRRNHILSKHKAIVEERIKLGLSCGFSDLIIKEDPLDSARVQFPNKRSQLRNNHQGWIYSCRIVRNWKVSDGIPMICISWSAEASKLQREELRIQNAEYSRMMQRIEMLAKTPATGTPGSLSSFNQGISGLRQPEYDASGHRISSVALSPIQIEQFQTLHSPLDPVSFIPKSTMDSINLDREALTVLSIDGSMIFDAPIDCRYCCIWAHDDKLFVCESRLYTKSGIVFMPMDQSIDMKPPLKKDTREKDGKKIEGDEKRSDFLESQEFSFPPQPSLFDQSKSSSSQPKSPFDQPKTSSSQPKSPFDQPKSLFSQLAGIRKSINHKEGLSPSESKLLDVSAYQYNISPVTLEIGDEPTVIDREWTMHVNSIPLCSKPFSVSISNDDRALNPSLISPGECFGWNKDALISLNEGMCSSYMSSPYLLRYNKNISCAEFMKICDINYTMLQCSQCSNVHPLLPKDSFVSLGCSVVCRQKDNYSMCISGAIMHYPSLKLCSSPTLNSNDPLDSRHYMDMSSNPDPITAMKMLLEKEKLISPCNMLTKDPIFTRGYLKHTSNSVSFTTFSASTTDNRNVDMFIRKYHRKYYRIALGTRNVPHILRSSSDMHFKQVSLDYFRSLHGVSVWVCCGSQIIECICGRIIHSDSTLNQESSECGKIVSYLSEIATEEGDKEEQLKWKGKLGEKEAFSMPIRKEHPLGFCPHLVLLPFRSYGEIVINLDQIAWIGVPILDSKICEVHLSEKMSEESDSKELMSELDPKSRFNIDDLEEVSEPLLSVLSSWKSMGKALRSHNMMGMGQMGVPSQMFGMMDLPSFPISTISQIPILSDKLSETTTSNPPIFVNEVLAYGVLGSKLKESPPEWKRSGALSFPFSSLASESRKSEKKKEEEESLETITKEESSELVPQTVIEWSKYIYPFYHLEMKESPTIILPTTDPAVGVQRFFSMMDEEKRTKPKPKTKSLVFPELFEGIVEYSSFSMEKYPCSFFINSGKIYIGSQDRASLTQVPREVSDHLYTDLSSWKQSIVDSHKRLSFRDACHQLSVIYSRHLPKIRAFMPLWPYFVYGSSNEEYNYASGSCISVENGEWYADIYDNVPFIGCQRIFNAKYSYLFEIPLSSHPSDSSRVKSTSLIPMTLKNITHSIIPGQWEPGSPLLYEYILASILLERASLLYKYSLRRAYSLASGTYKDYINEEFKSLMPQVNSLCCAVNSFVSSLQLLRTSLPKISTSDGKIYEWVVAPIVPSFFKGVVCDASLYDSREIYSRNEMFIVPRMYSPSSSIKIGQSPVDSYCWKPQNNNEFDHHVKSKWSKLFGKHENVIIGGVSASERFTKSKINTLTSSTMTTSYIILRNMKSQEAICILPYQDLFSSLIRPFQQERGRFNFEYKELFEELRRSVDKDQFESSSNMMLFWDINMNLDALFLKLLSINLS